eukprot:SAG11_NODE_33042_length_279_cov_0.866667_1_plen_33_part_10
MHETGELISRNFCMYAIFWSTHTIAQIQANTVS